MTSEAKQRLTQAGNVTGVPRPAPASTQSAPPIRNPSLAPNSSGDGRSRDFQNRH